MATIKRVNYAFQEPPFEDGDIVDGGNFCQLLPNTEICKTVKTLTINGGNFVNCKPQPTWVINGGNWCQKSFCTHKMPRLIEKGLTPCAEDCVHRQGAIKQWVDIPEGDYRDEKNSLEPTKAAVRTVEVADADGVIIQRFQKQAYVYEDILVKTGPQVISAAKVVSK